MFYKLLLICSIAFVVAVPLDQLHQLEEEAYLQPLAYPAEAPILVRQARSPQRNSLDLNYRQDGFGRTGSVEYNRNLYRSDNGRFNVDAYAQASRNFDYNRNNYGAGVRGTWRF